MTYYELDSDKRKFPSLDAAVAHAKQRRDYASIFRVIKRPEAFFRDYIHLGVLRPDGKFRPEWTSTPAERDTLRAEFSQLLF